MDINNISIKIKIISWWIDWWRDDKNYFCAVIQINNDQMQYIERELKNT